MFILEIEWDRPTPDSPNPPSLVGPFTGREEAFDWAHTHVGSGSYLARPVEQPWEKP